MSDDFPGELRAIRVARSIRSPFAPSEAARLAQTPAQRRDGARDAMRHCGAVLQNVLAEAADDSGAHEALAAHAFDALLDAFRRDFTDDAAALDLERAARFGDRFGELLVACDDWLRDPAVAGAARIALLARVGVWYGDDLGKPAWGMPYLEEARALAPNSVRVLRAIVRVQTAAGSLSPCEPVLRQILELDPSDREAADVLERILLGRGAIYDLVAFLEQRLRESGSVALNPLRVKLAVLHSTLPGGDARACELLAEAHALDTGNVDVLRALDARLCASKRWSELAPVLEERIERAETNRERVDLLMRLARVHEDHDHDPERAAQRLEQIVEVDPGSDGAWLALERCYSKLRLWDAAVYAYERHVDAVSDDEARVAAYAAMARVLGEELALPERAREAYSCALAIDPERVPILEEMARLCERTGDLRRAIELVEQIASRASEPPRRAEALCRLAAMVLLHTADTVRARALYREALDIDPANTAALRALRGLALQVDDVAEAARLLDREQRHTGDPRTRARLLVELAVLRRDRLDDARGSEHAFEEAHALDPDNDDAALAVAEANIGRSEWTAAATLLDKLAARALRRPVYEQIEILTRLGRAQLARGEHARAFEAFERARRLGPVDIEVVASHDESRSLWLAELHRAIAHDPMNVVHHRALYGLYARSGDFDRAYCVASVLVFLKGADGEQRALYTELRPRGAPDFRARLTRAAWIRDVAHPELDRAIGGVFEVIARAARVAHVRALNARGRLPSLSSVEREQREAPRRLAAKAFFGAAAVLSVDAPELWIRPELPGGVVVLPVEEGTSLLGASLLSGWSVPELMFVFGKHLTLHTGEHSVRAHAPSLTELETLLAAATRVVNPGACVNDAVARGHEALARELRPDERRRLAHVVEHGARRDVARWAQCSELTAVRAGLLLCGDLSIAAKILRREASLPGDLSANEKVKELIRFTVSDAYARLRSALGISVRSRSLPSDDDDEPTRDRALCA